MNRLNLLLTLTSINVLLVTVERFSFTGRVLLSPFNFLRLHEVFQISVLILFTVVIPFFLLKEASDNFSLLQTKKGSFLALLFVVGVYFYATGNGVHELGSFLFNQYCSAKFLAGNLCGGLFFNDYYFGNFLYFLGAVFMNLPFLVFERQKPNLNFKSISLRLLVINAVVYAFAIFAYAGFDKVLVGLVYSLVMTALAAVFYFDNKRKPWEKPLTTYLLVAYGLGTFASLIVRFLHR